MDAPAVADQLTDTVRAAVRRNGVGDFDGAAAILDEALVLTDELPPDDQDFWRARLLVTRAYSTFERYGERPATEQLEEARRLALGVGSRRLVALTYIQEANLLARGTSWAAAVAAGSAATAFVDALTTEERFALHLNRGLARMGLLDLDGAEEDYDAARVLAEEEGLDDLRFKAIHNRGCLAFVRSDLPRALVLMREADELPVDVARDRSRLDQAQVLIAAGLVDRAKSLLEGALAGAQHSHHHVEGAAIQLDLARCAILLGRSEEAQQLADRARQSFEDLGAEERSRRARLVAAQVALMDGDDLDEVERLLTPWSGPATTHPDERTATRLRAELMLRRGEVQQCLDLLGRLDPVTQGLDAQLHEDFLRAAAAVASGDRRRHRDTCRRAGARMARLQVRSQSLEMRSSLALHAGRLAAFDVEQALTSGRPASIFTSVERWRAASQRIPPVRPSTDPLTADLMRELRAVQQTRALATAASRPALSAHIEELSRRIERRDWERAREGEAGGRAAAVSVREAVRAATDAGTTVISLFAAGGELHALTVTDRVTHARIGPLDPALRSASALAADLRARTLSRRVPALARAVAAAVDDSTRRLDDLLFGPTSELAVPDSADVVIVPARSLASVPWNLLPSLRGHAVVASGSVTRWVRSSAASRLPTRVAVAAGPGLPHALAEAREVARLWAPGSLAPGPQGATLATAADVVAALDAATLVHLAAHGTHEEANPMFSTLRMADGPVFLHELPMPCRAEHVVLSACDVGRSNVRFGEEAFGVTAALLALGARSVVASVAPVDDAATHEAMLCYHQHLAGGTPAARALARVVDEHPAAATFAVYGADWAAEPASLR